MSSLTQKETNQCQRHGGSTKQQESEKLRMSLRQVGIERAALCEETKSLQMQVTAERQNSEQLHHELSTTKAKEAALITQREKQKAAAAAQNAIYSADTARLLEQIAKLERDSIPTRFRALY